MTTLLTFFRTWVIAPVATYRHFRRYEKEPLLWGVFISIVVIPAFPWLVYHCGLREIEKEFNDALLLLPR